MNSTTVVGPKALAPPLALEFEPRFCGNHVIDITVGCTFNCVYCPFAAIASHRHATPRPTLRDPRTLHQLPPPASVFLSPSSDPFAPQAAALSHDVLEQLLSSGSSVGIVTKGVIPHRTLDLLATYRQQVEGVAIGLTSLDDQRNDIVEPGCPPARKRLGNIRELASRDLIAAIRLDPILPALDDEPAALADLVRTAAECGAWAVTATYVFAWGRYLRRMRRIPYLTQACSHLTEKAPMEGGTAFSVPLSRKLETYGTLARLARDHGLRFNTCGCKDIRLRRQAPFSTSCRNTWYLSERGTPIRTEDSRVRNAGAPSAPPDAPRALRPGS